MGLCGSVLINTGQNLQSMALQSSEAVRAAPHKDRTWQVCASMWCPLLGTRERLSSPTYSLPFTLLRDSPRTPGTQAGMGTFMTGSILNFIAFTFASASILVPIEAVQFVTNVAFNKVLCCTH